MEPLFLIVGGLIDGRPSVTTWVVVFYLLILYLVRSEIRRRSRR